MNRGKLVIVSGFSGAGKGTVMNALISGSDRYALSVSATTRQPSRCTIAMVENCGIKVKGAAYGLVLTDDENKWWGGRMEQPKVAICPKCGEVSIYLENVEKLRNK